MAVRSCVSHLRQYVLLCCSYASTFFCAAVTAVRSGQYSVLAQNSCGASERTPHPYGSHRRHFITYVCRCAYLTRMNQLQCCSSSPVRHHRLSRWCQLKLHLTRLLCCQDTVRLVSGASPTRRHNRSEVREIS